MSEVPELVTRKPTGKPPWPMILLAGGEKSGKSWAAAAFSASTLVGRTFYIEVGEHYADEYGSIPGARYEIVPHDGTYRGIGYAIWAASKQPRVDDKPNCIILDSTTLLWDLISDMAQQEANRRKGKKADGEAQITMDLWNTAKRRWNDLLAILREHDGPVILTARLEQVTVMSANGQPTTEKTMKVRAEKNLPYEVDVVVQIPSPRKYEITGLRSVSWQLKPGAPEAAPEFTVDWLLRKLGLARDAATAPRSVTLPKPDGAPQAPQASQQQRQQQPPPASHEQKRDLSMLIGEKLGPDAARNRHNVMAQRFQRRITSFDQLTTPEALTAIGELRKMRPYQPPQTQEVYNRLHQTIEGADLDSIGQAMSTATEARDAGLIPPAAWEALSDFAEARTNVLIADAAGESGWDPADGDSTVPADVQHLQGVPA